MNPFRVIARPLLASAFIVDAIDALRHPQAHEDKLEPVEPALAKARELIPAIPTNTRTLVRLHAVVTLASGLMFALGKAPRTSAVVLALASTPSALVANPIRTKDQRAKNLGPLLGKAGLLAGLVFASTDRAGVPSLGWKYENWKDRREQIALAVAEQAASDSDKA